MHVKFSRMKEWLVEEIRAGPPGTRLKATRLEVFYGLHELSRQQRNARCDFLTEKKRFIFPDPENV